MHRRLYVSVNTVIYDNQARSPKRRELPSHHLQGLLLTERSLESMVGSNWYELTRSGDLSVKILVFTWPSRRYEESCCGDAGLRKENARYWREHEIIIKFLVNSKPCTWEGSGKKPACSLVAEKPHILIEFSLRNASGSIENIHSPAPNN